MDTTGITVIIAVLALCASAITISLAIRASNKADKKADADKVQQLEIKMTALAIDVEWLKGKDKR
jgi:hypothetical protein